MSNPDPTLPIVIVGAGWAGLAAALTLAKQNKPLMVLEAGAMPGGRARGVWLQNEMLDNGQHLLLGGYQQVLQQLKFLNINERQVFKREPFNISIHRPAHRFAHFKSFSAFPLPLSLFLGGLAAKGFTVKERLALCSFLKRLKQTSVQEVENFSIRALLQQFKQPISLIEDVWEPLALAALSTPLDRASAAIFLNVLQKTFTLHARNSDLLLPKVDLSSIFPSPACAYLKKIGQPVFYRERALQLLFKNDHCVGVKTNHHEWPAQAVILAVPPYVAANMLPELGSFTALKNNFKAFHYHPITTVYLQFKPGDIPRFNSRLMAFTQGIAQWMFDLSRIKQNNILSIVITGAGLHSDLNATELVKKILTEIRAYYPSLPDPLQTKVITEKRAAFCCNAEIVAKRPGALSSIPGLYLAGDYVNTEFPATLEGAVQSGVAAAEILINPGPTLWVTNK